MIENRIRQYGILWKQYLMKYKFLIPLMLFLSALFGMAQRFGYSQQEYRGLVVGVCYQDESGEILLENLKREEGIFTFIGYGEEDEMVRQVENGTLECGYVLPEGFFQRIQEGKMGRQITLYYSPASSAHGISFEVVFAELFDLLSAQVLEDYLKDQGWEGMTDYEAVRERLLALNKEYQENGDTFHFEFETVEGEISEEPSYLSMPRGLIALMIFLMSMLGLGNHLEQEYVWKAIPGRKGRELRSGSIHIAIAGSLLVGEICLLLGGVWQNTPKELAGLLIYFVALEIYVRVLSFFIRKSSMLYGLIPELLLGSCLFSPVFIRLETYVPLAAWISKIFPASYYLAFFLD